MLSSSRLFLFATLVALALGGCDCSSDPSNRDGGGGGNDDGGGDGGDTDPTDGGDDDGGGGGGDAGDGGGNGDGGSGTTCRTIAEACSGRCGYATDNCAASFDCSSTAGVQAGGLACNANQICSAGACMTVGTPPPTCPDPRTNTGTRCVNVQGQPGATQSCGEWFDSAGCRVDCWAQANHECPTAGHICSQSGNTGPFECRSGTGSGCTGGLCGGLPPACAMGDETALSGVVRTPGRDHDNNAGNDNINQVPVPNAIVYIPATLGAVPAIPVGIDENNATASCGRCADEEWTTGGASVLASAVTDYQGRFTLTGTIPTAAFDLVIKTGRWRRVVRIPAAQVTACAQNNTVTRAQGLLPSVGSADGLNNIPHIAVSTGNVDEMECVFRNIGLAEGQFTQPSVATTRTAARIHLYRGNGGQASGTCTTGGSTCRRTALYGTADNPENNRLFEYDMVVMDCEGGPAEHDDQEPTMVDYVDHGGRLFASHYSYSWIENNGTLDQSADWGASGASDSGTGFISLPSGNTARTRANSVKSLVFRDFLNFNGAISMAASTPQFTIAFPRDRAGANVGPSTDEWVYRTSNDTANGANPRVQQLSFTTPYGASATAACGRVAFSGFHVANADNDSGDIFPYCSNGALTAQEYTLVYQLFDLNSCVSTGVITPPSPCIPDSKTDVCGPTPGVTCGQFSNGCGGIINCDPCDAGEFCSGNTCMMSTCDAQTCAELGVECGQHSDQCGGLATGCSPCPNGEFCSNGQCVSNCVPAPNPCGSDKCGTLNDSCGNPVDCGNCAGLPCVDNMCVIE